MSEPSNDPIPADGGSTILEILPAFEQHMKEAGFAHNTVKSFASDVRLIGSYFPDKPINQYGTEDLNKFLHWLKEERGISCKPKSYARRVTTMKVLFGWLSKSDVVVINPAEAVVQESASSPLPDIPNEEQIAQALAVAESWRSGKTITGESRKADVRPLLLLKLLLQTGGKKGEIKGIHLEHILREDEDNPQIFVRYANPRLRYKERKVAIDPEWVKILDEYTPAYNIHDELFTCTPRNLEYILTNIGEEAGLERGLLSFENLRWVSALEDLKNGMDQELIREKLGLSKITWRETRAKLDRLREKENS